MKSEYEIYMDYNAAIRQAERLESIARKVRSMGQESMSSTFNSIRASWTGENSEAFLDKGNVLKSKVLRVADDVAKTARVIREIAERTKNAELEAIRIATD